MFPSPFQSTHPLRGATSGQLIKIAALHISIHAPLAGCDNRERIRLYGVFGISIHAPLAGCDSGSRTSCGSWSHFNPRTPRGVRLRQRRRSDRAGHISIHAPLAGCDAVNNSQQRNREISIHAPLAGCDDRGSCNSGSRRYFNPRTPLAGCDFSLLLGGLGFHISIHTPLAGCDPTVGSAPTTPSPFQSTHPLRGATPVSVTPGLLMRFQSTHPSRGATGCNGIKVTNILISIHAPLARCDVHSLFRLGLPLGISIHAPLAGCDFIDGIVFPIAPRRRRTHPVSGKKCAYPG